MTIREYISKKTGKPAYTVCVRRSGLISTRTFTSRVKAEDWERLEGKRLLRKVPLSNTVTGEGGHFTVSQVIEQFKLHRLSFLSKSWASYLKWVNCFIGKIRLKDHCCPVNFLGVLVNNLT